MFRWWLWVLHAGPSDDLPQHSSSSTAASNTRLCEAWRKIRVLLSTPGRNFAQPPPSPRPFLLFFPRKPWIQFLICSHHIYWFYLFRHYQQDCLQILCGRVFVRSAIKYDIVFFLTKKKALRAQSLLQVPCRYVLLGHCRLVSLRLALPCLAARVYLVAEGVLSFPFFLLLFLGVFCSRCERSRDLAWTTLWERAGICSCLPKTPSWRYVSIPYEVHIVIWQHDNILKVRSITIPYKSRKRPKRSRGFWRRNGGITAKSGTRCQREVLPLRPGLRINSSVKKGHGAVEGLRPNGSITAKFGTQDYFRCTTMSRRSRGFEANGSSTAKSGTQDEM